MASNADALQTARDALVQRIAAVAALAGPTYTTEEGLTIQKASMLQNLRDELTALDAVLNYETGPWEEVSIGVGV